MTTPPPAAAQPEVQELLQHLSKQLKALERLSTIALPASALVSVGALLAGPLLALGVGAVVGAAVAAVTGVNTLLLRRKQAEMREQINRLVEEQKLPREEASRLLSEVNRVTEGGRAS